MMIISETARSLGHDVGPLAVDWLGHHKGTEAEKQEVYRRKGS